MTMLRVREAADLIGDLEHHLARLAAEPAKLTDHLAGPHAAVTATSAHADLTALHYAAHAAQLAAARLELADAEDQLADGQQAALEPHCDFCATTGTHATQLPAAV